MSEFTTKDLRTGMTVVMGDGGLAKCIASYTNNEGHISFVRANGQSLVTTPRVDSNFNYTGEWSEYNIDKVYDRPNGTLAKQMECDTTTKCLWSRELPVKEMTVADIEAQLGYAIKVVK